MKPVIRYCKCGCGQIIDKKQFPGAIYAPGHYVRKPLTEEQKRKKLEKTKKTCLERYGCDNPSKNKEIQQKISENLSKLNSDPDKKKEIQNKRKETTYQRYGVDCITKSEEMKKKSKQTCLERYGSEYSRQSDIVKNKAKQTCLERYGVEYSCQSPEVIKKIKEKFIEHYGVDNPGKCKEIIEKTKQHNLEKYGVEWAHQVPEVVEKTRKTCIERYGTDNVFKVDKIKEKFKQTFTERYGVDNPTKVKDITDRSTKWIKEIAWKRIENQTQWIPLFTKEDFKGWKISCSDEYLSYKFKCSKCGHIEEFFGSTLLRCPECYPDNTRSVQENDIYEFIKTFLSDDLIITNDRQILDGKELDIVIPSKKLAFEYNGLYWHSNKFSNDKNYHINKTITCKNKGIQLIHIFEDDWIQNQNIVKSRIKNLLGIYNHVIYARKCEVKVIEDSSYLLFLEENHIQGYIASSYALGLYYNNELVSVMTFGKYRRSMGRNSVENEYEMYRFCNKLGYHIPGAASRLFKHFIELINPKKIISYADRCWSEGNLYEKIGFNFIKLTTPNYWYFKGNKRENRFKYRKSELPKLLKNFDSNQTEQQNMVNNGYMIIYDCGSLLYEWINPNYSDL